MTPLYAGLVVWLITLILVESELVRPVRELFQHRPKLAYFVGCHLCCGCWVAIGVALAVPGPLPFTVLNAALYKAVGHGILEVTALLKRLAV